MKILGIETSSIVASVAITENELLLGETTINHPKKHSQKLMPIIKNLFKSLNMTIDDIDLIAVSNGPGSFTGIRIGLTTAKALAHKSKIPVVTVSTLESLAMNDNDYTGKVFSIIDARRKNIFVNEYDLKNGIIVSESEPSMEVIDDYLNIINECSGKVLLVGSGVTENIEYIIENKNENVILSDMNSNFPVAKTLCILGSRLEKDNYNNYDNVKANYIRKSQAEISIAQKGK